MGREKCSFIESIDELILNRFWQEADIGWTSENSEFSLSFSKDKNWYIERESENKGKHYS